MSQAYDVREYLETQTGFIYWRVATDPGCRAVIKAVKPQTVNVIEMDATTKINQWGIAV